MAADVLAGGKSSRLYKRLVYDLQIAQNVFAFQRGRRPRRRSSRSWRRPGPATRSTRSTKVIDEELERLRATPPEPREVERVINGYEADVLRGAGTSRLGGRADQLNAYVTQTGNPTTSPRISRGIQALTPTDIQAAVPHVAAGRIGASSCPSCPRRRRPRSRCRCPRLCRPLRVRARAGAGAGASPRSVDGARCQGRRRR